MSARAETLLWLAQRASAVVLAFCVAIHLATMIYAVQGGLSAGEILGRTRGSMAWLGFYGLFVMAAAIHAPIGLRAVIGETVGWRGRALDLALCVFALALAWLGWRAILGLFR